MLQRQLHSATIPERSGLVRTVRLCAKKGGHGVTFTSAQHSHTKHLVLTGQATEPIDEARGEVIVVYISYLFQESGSIVV